MRIESVILRDVGPFKDARIDFPKGSDDALADVYLLTGPNGCGKSTVLYAIAAAIGAAALRTEFLDARLRSDGAHAIVGTDESEYAVARSHDSHIPSAGANAPPLRRLNPPDEEIGYYKAKPIAHYAQRAASYRRESGSQAKFNWAAFAYAGTRSLSTVEVLELTEPKASPFERSLSFDRTSDTKTIVQWIAGQQFKRLKAREAGDEQRALEIEQSISDIEKVVADVVDDPGFKFVTGVEDNNIRVRHRGVVVEMGVLPDGLKSIVAWVADLLMRLDRIPWLIDVPTPQRSFLLLLDEIDIHLHPAWQRKVLPIVQRMFPKAQIIASTHSPFVVASASDAHVIALGVEGGAARVESAHPSQQGVSYSAVLRSIFGVTSEFDVETESELQAFHEAKARLLRGDAVARGDVDRIAHMLATRSEELREIVGLELRQLERQQRLAQ